MGISAAVLVLVLFAALVGGAVVLGAPALAIPIVLVALAGWMAVTTFRRARGQHPLPGEERGPIDFTDEDHETLVPSPGPEERASNRRRAAADR